MKKKLAVITFYLNSAEFYSKQLKNLFSDYMEVEKYSFYDLSIEKGVTADLILIPSWFLLEIVKKYFKNNSEIIVANRTLSKCGFDKIMQLPQNTKVILANVSLEMCMETISLIYQLGARHIELIPVYPGMNEIPDLDIAITPGELECVPSSVGRIVDIGDRVLDISTIMDIAVKLGAGSALNNLSFKQYFSEIIPVNFGLEEIIGKSIRLESQLDVLLQILEQGVLGINANGIVSSYNSSAEKIIGFKSEEVLGRHYSEQLNQLPFLQVLENCEIIEEKLIKVNGTDIAVTVVPIESSNILHGAVAIVKRFSDAEKKQHKLRLQLIGKGHRAKYTFEDIAGCSELINKSKDIACRMAKSDSSVMITGESGTGKELFAQAIHNSSPRKNYQFVAINCAAMPESLLESELFGYEEGAFTGARKGGKLGLFELAHKGTLFLDEIGEMPINLQARLLRVLQEREVMRIGGDSVIHVDVRIIAATNRDLKELVGMQKFRKDLYFRLNVLTLKIPPLRERMEDIPLLIEEIKKDFRTNFKLDSTAMKRMLTHDWEGNVRELKNYVEYMANLGQNIITEKDLPFEYEQDKECYIQDGSNNKSLNTLKNITESEIPKYLFVMQELKSSYLNRKRVGRRSIALAASEKDIFLTEQEIRRILINLENSRIVEISKGRGGTRITNFGIDLLKELMG